MSKIQQIADDLLAQEKAYRAVLKAGEFLRSIGNIEQLEQEHQARAAKAKADAASAATQLADAQAKVVAAQAQHDTIAKSAKQAIVDARAARDAMIADAQKVIAAERSAANAQITQLQGVQSGLERSIANTKAELEQSLAEYNDLSAQLEALRKTAASIAGQ